MIQRIVGRLPRSATRPVHGRERRLGLWRRREGQQEAERRQITLSLSSPPPPLNPRVFTLPLEQAAGGREEGEGFLAPSHHRHGCDLRESSFMDGRDQPSELSTCKTSTPPVFTDSVGRRTGKRGGREGGGWWLPEEWRRNFLLLTRRERIGAAIEERWAQKKKVSWRAKSSSSQLICRCVGSLGNDAAKGDGSQASTGGAL